jgi:hypothetical protein
VWEHWTVSPGTAGSPDTAKKKTGKFELQIDMQEAIFKCKYTRNIANRHNKKIKGFFFFWWY